MDRRQFLKLAACAGLTVAGPMGSMRLVRASESNPYEGKFWVTIHASGGWDPTSLCDPKGRVNDEEENPVNMFYTGDIGEIGNHRYAPVAGNQAFFEKYHSQLLVLNGVDTSTNGHDSGTRHIWSGDLREGYPSLSALVAGAFAPQQPMAFVTSGGYDFTANLVAPTRVGDTGVLAKLAHPNQINVNNPVEISNAYHSDATITRIEQAQATRLERQRSAQSLPRLKHALNMLHTARVGGNELDLLTDVLPDPLDNSGNPLKRQAQVAIAAYKAGLAVSANLVVGGFDTHSNHDANQFPRLQLVTEGIDFLMEEAERQGVADKIVVVVGSDFGRTPSYNEGNGKDHWSITSMMMMGPGIPGNRVIGLSDAYHHPVTIDPQTFQASEDGLRITPAHIHRALRQVAGLDGNPTADLFPLKEDVLPFFAES
jgi:uncharacterized protein (DUF1501 family)